MNEQSYVPGPYPVARLEDMSVRFADFFWAWRKPAYFPSLSAYGDLEWVDHRAMVDTPWFRECYVRFTRILMDNVCAQLSALSDFPEVKAFIAELSDLVGTCATGAPSLAEHRAPDDPDEESPHPDGHDDE
ncbi:MAG: hypothetical protein M3Q23_03595 [Actinomycetota bacterium]|nr:hypothetical protein [Actinomycetota bacterium]